MYKEIAKLIMYGNMKEDTILVKLGEIFRAFDEKTEDNAQLIRDIYTQLKRLLEVATDYGFVAQLSDISAHHKRKSVQSDL